MSSNEETAQSGCYHSCYLCARPLMDVPEEYIHRHRNTRFGKCASDDYTYVVSACAHCWKMHVGTENWVVI